MSGNTAFLENIKQLFDWVEYTVFAASLIMSMLVGVYFGFIKKAGQDTVEGYMLGSKQMSLLPVTLSLVASFISGITLLGIPAEVYMYGTQVMGACVGMIASGFVNSVFFLPVFYKLQLLSLYEYLERRFDSRIRKCVSGMYIFTTLMWVALAIYVPALAINQVTGLSVHMVTPVVSSVCIFYTTVGGLKAVVWADTLQTMFMIGALIIIVVIGTIDVGGISKVYEAASTGDRLEIFNMDTSLTARMTFWSSSLGYTVFWIYAAGTSAAMVQRFISLPTSKLAHQAMFLYVVGCCAFFLLSAYVGLLMFTKYQYCDPVTIGIAKKPEQITPIFVLEAVGHIKGIPGLFISGVLAAALSTMSTCMNAMAVIIYEDFITPCMKRTPSDSTSSLYMKWISFVIGVITVVLVLLVEKLGAVLEISSMFGGATAGIIVGVFSLALFVPFANGKGTLIAFATSSLYMIWTIGGFNYYNKKGIINYKDKGTSVEGCHWNVSTTSEPKIEDETEHSVLPIYRLSIFYYSVAAFLIVVIVGLVVSKMTGGRESTTLEKDLFHPLVHRFLIKKEKLLYGDNGYVAIRLMEQNLRPLESRTNKGVTET